MLLAPTPPFPRGYTRVPLHPHVPPPNATAAPTKKPPRHQPRSAPTHHYTAPHFFMRNRQQGSSAAGKSAAALCPQCSPPPRSDVNGKPPGTFGWNQRSSPLRLLLSPGANSWQQGRQTPEPGKRSRRRPLFFFSEAAFGPEHASGSSAGRKIVDTENNAADVRADLRRALGKKSFLEGATCCNCFCVFSGDWSLRQPQDTRATCCGDPGRTQQAQLVSAPLPGGTQSAYQMTTAIGDGWNSHWAGQTRKASHTPAVVCELSYGDRIYILRRSVFPACAL